jgi:hypothetical protein
MSGYDRLQRIQQKLIELGITDFKVFWAWTNRERPMSEKAAALADVLEAYLEGRFRSMPALGDSVRADTSSGIRP